jgi:hypothetical protein
VKTIAKIISYVFHPLLLATYLILVVGAFFPSMLMIRNLLIVALFVFAFTFLFPALNIGLFRFLGTITSFQMESRRERKQPFIIIAIMYVGVAYLFYTKNPFNANFNKLMIIVAALVVAATILTFFIKVSVHSLAMGGWIGILLPLLRFSPELLLPTVLIIVISGLVISSRLLLNAHTLKEAMIGCLMGFVVGFGGMIVLF